MKAVDSDCLQVKRRFVMNLRVLRIRGVTSSTMDLHGSFGLCSSLALHAITSKIFGAVSMADASPTTTINVMIMQGF